MIKPDYDIIMLALPRWDGLYASTAYSLARELSRFTRVFYIDNPFTWKDYLSGKNTPQIARRKSALKGRGDIYTTPDASLPNLTAVTPRLVYPINWLPEGSTYNFASGINDGILFETIERLISEKRIKRFVFINSFNPLYGHSFPKRFSPALTIYHSVDNISESAYIAKHGTYREKVAVQNADLTVVTSSELYATYKDSAKDLLLLPNAADTKLFAQALHADLPKPKEFDKVPPQAKVIFYMGNICHRLDYELLVRIARENKDAVLMMTGPITNEGYKTSGLFNEPNVVFTGRKDLRELPSYLKYVDCCIIPFLCNDLTKSIYPLKINEYLSAGRPVVTTDFSRDITNFAAVAYVSASHEEFLTNIRRALAEPGHNRSLERSEFVKENNWQARAEVLLRTISEKIMR